MNDVNQSHCPDCGLHKDAVTVVVHQAAGGWKCERCLKRATLKANPPPAPVGTPQSEVQIPCPQHFESAPGSQCSTCGGLGVVRVPASQIKSYDPNASRVLTEG